MEGGLYMYRVPTATEHGRELQAPSLGFGATMLSKCKKIVYKCRWKLCRFAKDKNSIRRKLLIHEFQ